MEDERDSDSGDGGVDDHDDGDSDVVRRPPDPSDLRGAFDDVGYERPAGAFPWRGGSTDADVADDDYGSLGGLGTPDRGLEAASAAARVAEQIRSQILANAALSALPSFEGASFMASVKGARITIGGDMEITLSVSPAEKYRAIALTDAVGIQVLIKAERKRRRTLTVLRNTASTMMLEDEAES